MEVLAGVVSKVAEKLIDPVWNLVSSPVILAYNYKKNVADLENKVKVLKEEKERVERCVEDIESKGEEACGSQTWLTETRGLICDVDEELKTDRYNVKKHFCGMCSNPVSLYKMSKKATEKAESIDSQTKKKADLNLQSGLALAPLQQAASTVPGFQDFPSRRDVLDKIMLELQSARVNRIGLHGMAGSGKSMLVRELQRKAEADKMFEKVVLVKVTEKPELKRIRDQIARGLGMYQLSTDLTSLQVTDRIEAKLMKIVEKGKVLFILDDVWTKLDLKEIGISFPEADPTGEESFQWKVLFTSRDRNVFSDVSPQQVFEIGKIKHLEARGMFINIVGDAILADAELKSIAEQIIEQISCFSIDSAAIKASGASAAASAGPVSCKVERSSPVRPSPILNGVDPMARSAEKPRTIEDSTDKTKPWQLAEIVEPVQCRLVTLPESADASSKVVRLLYTNSGVGILALGSNGVQKLWKWARNEQNPSGKATASVVPQHWQPNSGLLMNNDVTGVNLEEAVPCIALSKNDSYVMSATGGKVSLFNMMTFKVMTTFMSPPPASTFLAFHPQDNNIIAIGMEDSTIHIYNVRVDEVKSKLKGHQKRITGLAFSTNLNILVSSGADAQLCVWSIDTWEKRKSVPIQIPAGKAPNGETRVQFHADQIRMLVVHETQLSIYDASKMERIRQWIPQEGISAPISHATYSCNSQSIFATFCDGHVGVFDANTLRLRCRIAPSAYLPQTGNQPVFPLVVAAHPSDPNQFGDAILAIATVANALKGRELPEWQSALTILSSPSPHNFSSNGVSESIYAAIEVSYNQLESKELKQVFLLSGMLGPNFSLESLLKYGIGLGLFPRAYTIQEAQAELLTLINRLKAASLLIESSDGRVVDS